MDKRSGHWERRLDRSANGGMKANQALDIAMLKYTNEGENRPRTVVDKQL